LDKLYKYFGKLYVEIKLLFYKSYYRNFKTDFNSYISPSVDFMLDKNCEIIFSKGVRIYKNCIIKVRGNACLSLGENVSINSGCILAAKSGIHIGKNSILAPNVLIFDHNHVYSDLDHGFHNQRLTSAPINIGNNCWIGAGCIILKGANIGDNCLIGAGSVINSVIPSNSRYVQKRISSISILQN